MNQIIDILLTIFFFCLGWMAGAYFIRWIKSIDWTYIKLLIKWFK